MFVCTYINVPVCVGGSKGKQRYKSDVPGIQLRSCTLEEEAFDPNLQLMPLYRRNERTINFEFEFDSIC